MLNLTTPGPISLEADPASANGLLVTEHGEYLLQRRDDRPDVWFPGYCGLFGGEIEYGETPEGALRRELFEELNFHVKEVIYFTQLAFDFRRWNHGIKLRYIYLVPITRRDIEIMVLNEGAGMELHGSDRVMCVDRLTPHDAMVIALHMAQQAVEHAPR